MGNIFNDDFRDFIQSLNHANVNYILVGGFSVILHGYSRVTGDMDIWVEKTKENYDKIVQAFKEFGMPVFDMVEEKFLSKATDSEVFRFGTSPSRIDLMTVLKGLEFIPVFKDTEWVEVEGLKVRLIHFNQLIESKKASNRNKDKEDIKKLSSIRKKLS